MIYGKGSQPVGHIHLLRPICVTLCPTFKIFSLPFDVDCREVPLQLQMKIVDLQCSDDLKKKFLSCYILGFYKNHMLPFGLFPNLIIHTQKVGFMFDSIFYCKEMFSWRKHTKRMLPSLLSNHHLFDVFLQPISYFNPGITSFCNCKQHQISH